MVDLASSPYLRFPHVRGDLATFVADDDVWLAPLAGGRAWHEFYVRHAATDGQTIVYVGAGELWALDAAAAAAGDAEPRLVDVELSGARQGRQPRTIAVGDHRGPVAVDRTGRATLRVLARGTGMGVENHGVDPDVEVVVTPLDRVAGRDPQLDVAIRVALEALERRPATEPPEPPTV